MKKQKTKLPEFMRPYFWDVEFNELEIERSASYIIHRLLSLGDDKAVRWMFKTYTKGMISDVLINRRGFSAKTANFWADLLNVDKKKVVCLQTHYLKMRQELWPY